MEKFKFDETERALPRRKYKGDNPAVFNVDDLPDSDDSWQKYGEAEDSEANEQYQEPELELEPELKPEIEQNIQKDPDPELEPDLLESDTDYDLSKHPHTRIPNPLRKKTNKQRSSRIEKVRKQLIKEYATSKHNFYVERMLRRYIKEHPEFKELNTTDLINQLTKEQLGEILGANLNPEGQEDKHKAEKEFSHGQNMSFYYRTLRFLKNKRKHPRRGFELDEKLQENSREDDLEPFNISDTNGPGWQTSKENPTSDLSNRGWQAWLRRLRHSLNYPEKEE